MDLTTQGLIDSGGAWHLEGAIGRQCMAAIEAGDARLGHHPRQDAYGSWVPAWWQVEPGTKGSPEYADLDREDVRAEALETSPELAELLR